MKVMDSEPNEFISAALRNSVVLRALMQHFSNSELLQLSLVNKQWNYEAKSLIRDRGIFPSFKSGQSTCEELEAFASNLRHMAVVPFTGMSIQVCKDIAEDSHVCTKGYLDASSTGMFSKFSDPHFKRLLMRSAHLTRKWTETWDPSNDVILDRLPLKHLSLHIHKNSANQKNCQAILLAKKMLQHFSEVIEELSINAQHHQFIQDYNIPDLSFRRLKTLKITGLPKERNGWERDFVKGLVSRAPNLEHLQTCGSLRFMDEILEGSSAMVVPYAGLDPFDTELPESRFERLRIEKLVLFTTSQNFSVERFNSRIPALLQTYRTTLNTLHIDVQCIGPLMSYGLCFPNVTEFKIYMNFARLAPCPAYYVTLLKVFDFTRTLPALTKVGINPNNSSNPFVEIPNFFEQGNAVLGEPMLDGSVNIKQLCLTNYFKEGTAPFLSETFQNIEILSLEGKWGSTFLCDQIWNHWANLKTIEAEIRGQGRPDGSLHVDSSICGIFPEEVAELREKDDEFLKNVNIVPVMPAIGCFSELRTLKLTYVELGADDLERNNRLLCSKVAGLLVFARCPNLSVIIHNEWPELQMEEGEPQMEEALDHMRPYASVILKRGLPVRCGCEIEGVGDEED